MARRFRNTWSLDGLGRGGDIDAKGTGVGQHPGFSSTLREAHIRQLDESWQIIED